MAYELTRTERIQYRQRQDDAFRAGEAAAANLRAALALAGLVLPSLGNDGPVGCRGIVRLGGCSTAVAERLAEVIAAGARARAGHDVQS
ncbi:MULTISPECIES: hypothetical protein [Streptomyces]|jgi:hypothetical protein|uniref:hypothetical protein n=1 Tax=Streptomyces TaxID=1883 RepID=UPI0021AF8447|nr:hypothetical protein [Streptomyces sp. WAC05292]